MIFLVDENQTMFARIWFYRSPWDVPQHDTKGATGFINCHYPPEQYSDVLDLLRNEGPVYLHFSDTREMGYLSTAREPVGEGELQQGE